MDFHSLSLIDGDENGKYVLYIFGRTIDNKSICVKTIDFTPYFYIEKPSEVSAESFREMMIDVIENYIQLFIKRNQIDRDYIDCLCKHRISFEKRIPFDKYHGKDVCKYMLRLAFWGHQSMKKFSYYIRQKSNRRRIIDNLNRKGYNMPNSFINCSIYDEVNFESKLKLCHRRNISPCGWIHVENYKELNKINSWQDIDIICKFQDLNPSKDLNQIPKVMCMSYDLECFSENYMMPQSKKLSDEIIQIGATFREYGSNNSVKKYIICQKICGDMPTAKDSIAINCKDEKELLLKFGQIIFKMNPDVVYGYNTYGFDDEYIFERLIKRNCVESFSKITSRSKKIFSDLLFAGRADKNQDQVPKYYHFPGRITLDVMMQIKNNVMYKLKFYNLNYVSKYFLNDKKNDLEPHEIFDYYRDGSPNKIGIIADYCVQDCELVHKLVSHLSLIPGNIGMSRVNHVPYQYIVLRGQGIKILSNTGYNMMQRDDPKFIIEIKQVAEQDKYGGAVVLPPKCGIYTEYLVSVGDFSSLYPSIMIAHNISHDTIVEDPRIIEREGPEKFEKMYYINNKTGEKIDVTYLRREYGIGLLCSILDELLAERKKIRSGLYTVNDHITIIKEIAEGVKKKGEKIPDIINRVKHDGLLECGDWVKDFKIKDISDSGFTLQYNNRTSVVEYCNMNKLLIDLKGESIVKDAMQLAMKITANSVYGQCGAPTSAIYRKELASTTTTWGQKYIKMAKDYGEKNYNAECIYGDSVTGDTPLLIKYPDETIDIKTIETLSDEWVEYDNFKQGEPDRINKQQASVNLQVWSNGRWADIKRVIRHRTHKQLFRVNTYKGCVDVTEDHSLLTNKGEKIKPADCEIGTKLLHSFPKNIIPIDDKKYDDNIFDSKIEAQKAYYWYKSKGNNNLIVDFVNNKYVFNFNKDILTCNKDKIRQIIKLPNIGIDTFVYDLETSEGIFHAGVGECVVKNTDSIFMRFPYKIKNKDHKQELLNRVYNESKEMYDKITKKIGRYPMKLSYEKIIAPLILMGKKNYCGLWHEEDMTKPKFKMMGCKAKKREYANIVNKMFMDSVNTILWADNYKQALRNAWKRFYCLCKSINKYPLKYFVLTKKLGSNYKDPLSQGHKVLADRIAERDPGNAPKPSQRIPIVHIQINPFECEEHMFTKTGVKKFKNNSKSLRKDDVRSGYKMETPEFIMKNGLKVDYDHYILKQLATPMIGMYRLSLPLHVIEYVFRDILNHEVRVNLKVEKTKGYGGDTAIKEKAELKIYRMRQNKIYYFTKEELPYVNFVKSIRNDVISGKVILQK